MAGTNTSITPETQLKAPVIILVRPQLGENIGMCARAMLNCAVSELRIVAPRELAALRERMGVEIAGVPMFRGDHLIPGRWRRGHAHSSSPMSFSG